MAKKALKRALLKGFWMRKCLVMARIRTNGPLDCLNWDDSDEEEFTPFTQANPSPVSSPVAPIVVAKKSSGKGNVAKNKKSGNGVSSSRKGKSLGELMFCYKHFALEKRMWSVGRSVCETHTPSNIKHIPFILHSQWKKGCGCVHG